MSSELPHEAGSTDQKLIVSGKSSQSSKTPHEGLNTKTEGDDATKSKSSNGPKEDLGHHDQESVSSTPDPSRSLHISKISSQKAVASPTIVVTNCPKKSTFLEGRTSRTVFH